MFGSPVQLKQSAQGIFMPKFKNYKNLFYIGGNLEMEQKDLKNINTKLPNNFFVLAVK